MKLELSTGYGYGPVSINVELDTLGRSETPIWAYAPNAGHFHDYNNVKFWEESQAGEYITEYTESNPFTPIRILALTQCPDNVAQFVRETLVAFSEYPILDEDSYFAAEFQEAQELVAEECNREEVPFDEIWEMIDEYYADSGGIWVPNLATAIDEWKAKRDYFARWHCDDSCNNN